jgi:phosphatidylinositol-3,4,5-trisphosphate 3-phosphatase/dual-specificity protein phosphatase PTEN
MASYARKKVSKKKRRFEQDGFDLDLVYITPRIIAMGFPSSGKEALYRNPLTEVYRFFETKHKDHYKLYNLCAEKEYDVDKFHKRVARYPFYDHNAPRLQLIADCCKDIDDWLKADEQHIVGINCKAGKGRTGLIICCFLLYSGLCNDTTEALKFYGDKRTKDGKGVTIASQQRYIRYYEYCLKNLRGLVPKVPKLMLDKLVVTSLPKIAGAQHVEIEIDNIVCFKSKSIVPKKGEDNYEIHVGGEVQGDCKIQLWVKTERLCHFWINTGFYQSESKLFKDTIDVANKDKSCSIFKKDFAITPIFSLLQKADSSSSGEELILKELEKLPASSSSEEKKPKKSSSASQEDKAVEKPKKIGSSAKRSDKKSAESGKRPNKRKGESEKGNSEKNSEAGSDLSNKDKRSSRRSLAPQGVKKDLISSDTGSSKKDRKSGKDSSPKSSGRSSKKAGSSKTPKTDKAETETPKPDSGAVTTPDVPVEEAQRVEEPNNHVVAETAPEKKDTNDSSPRTREHAKSFYKYSDYKEVIEKMRSAGNVSDEESDESDSSEDGDLDEEQKGVSTPA